MCGVIDYERTGAWLNVSVRASDNGSPTALYSLLHLHVRVNDVNDHSPRCAQHLSTTTTTTTTAVEVAEDAPLNATLASVAASDGDSPAGVNGQLVYSLVDDMFRVDSLSGVLLPRRRLVGRTGLYELSVVVSDRGSPPRATTCTLRVLVTPVNVYAPRFVHPSSSSSQSTLAQSVDPIERISDTQAGAYVTTVKAVDGDGGEQAMLRGYGSSSSSLSFELAHLDEQPAHVEWRDDWTSFDLDARSGVLSVAAHANLKKTLYTVGIAFYIP